MTLKPNVTGHSSDRSTTTRNPSATAETPSPSPSPSLSPSPLSRKFAPFRSLVPLLAQSDDPKLATSTTTTTTTIPYCCYLNAASAPPSNLIVHESLTRYASESLYCPSPHRTYWRPRAESARRLLARCLNARSPDDVAFARDTTEAMGCFIRGLADGGVMLLGDGDNVVVAENEYPNQVYGWRALRDHLATRGGRGKGETKKPVRIEIRFVPNHPDRVVGGGGGGEGEYGGGAITAETLRPYVDDRTRAIGLSSVMYDTGQRNDVRGICEAFAFPRGKGSEGEGKGEGEGAEKKEKNRKKKKIHVLVDAAQHVGFAPLDVQTLGASAVAFTLHKGLSCPTGIAALWVDPAFVAAAEPIPCAPSLQGVVVVPEGGGSGTEEEGEKEGKGERKRKDEGDEEEEEEEEEDGKVRFWPDARRFEHQNLSLVGAGAAEAFLRFYLDVLGPEDVQAYLYELGDALLAGCDGLGIGVASPRARGERASHLYVLRLRAQGWAEFLEGRGVWVTRNRLGIRVGFGWYNNQDDVVRLLEVLRLGIEAGLPVC
ncbi:PLP-dependent transferase [Xylariomycetidae sp. FL2044]|nr:PLP-dependent transferase [Xylariomycetidae sp. FL2044]